MEQSNWPLAARKNKMYSKYYTATYFLSKRLVRTRDSVLTTTAGMRSVQSGACKRKRDCSSTA
eukprot:6174029-Pleurochrysis_carterae.AAC.3